MEKKLQGLHHVTAIAGEPQQNIDFYYGVLGLRLVKLTVNYDDPETYHLYFGDEEGHPGTILTFFPWPGAQRGRRGTGQVTTTSFSVPEDSLGYWVDRFASDGVLYEEPIKRFDEEVLTFYDPDGLQLELVAHAGADVRRPWEDGPVPVKHALRGFHGITLSQEGYARTAALLTNTMGYELVMESGNRFRYQLGIGGPGMLVDVLSVPDADPGWVAVGTVHHVAFRTPDGEQQQAWREEIENAGYNVTPIIDRKYFHSIYFREPGGVLFEIATDPPGFTADEPLEKLGTRLALPPWLEPVRMHLERGLPRLKLPQPAKVG